MRIREGLANGMWVPVLRHLALRRHTDAMTDLADRLSASDSVSDLGSMASPSSAAGLYRRAWRLGDSRAAANAAASCFNRDDLAGYRLWLRRAAKAGDPDAAAELRRFEIRLPHDAAARIGRLRPDRRG